MDAIGRYFGAVREVLDKVERTQAEAMEQAADWFAEAVKGGNCIFAFGCSHAGLLALELYYRTGGLAVINPVRAPGLCLDIDPATMTSQLERMADYGRIIVDNQPMRAGDVFLIHSVSGRNAVTVDAALRAKEKGRARDRAHERGLFARAGFAARVRPAAVRRGGSGDRQLRLRGRLGH